jgi:hypothetical protein
VYKKLIGCILLANLVFSMFIPVTLSIDEALWWDENWSFRQEIILPINTSSKHAHHLPIDIRIEFDSPCWAKDENEHSVRVVFQDVGMVKELESQIYDLSYTDDNYISACSLVFLVPEEVNGDERYYAYYDDMGKSGPGYPDHVEIEESYYRYEPLPGYLFESRHYEITEGGFIVYGVAYEGKVMDPNVDVCQQVVKLKSNVRDMMPKNGDQVASFNSIYWYRQGKTWQGIKATQLVSRNIFVDGNLMIKFYIASKSADGRFQTTAVYKYYYCPNSDKRIYVHVKNEVLNSDFPSSDEIEVTYVTLSCGVFRSSTIDDLNFGWIPPYTHVYGEEERVLMYENNPYPEGEYIEPINKKTDCDLGSRAWISIDDGESGKAHAIIFDSNEILKSGTDELQGISLVQGEWQRYVILGLDSRFANFYLMRNGYESGGIRDEEIPGDLVVEFDAEFFSTENGGYRRVEDEADMFQSLIKYQPISDENVTDVEETESEYSLTLYTHLPPSLSLQLKLSRLLRKKPYISAELYHDDELFASGRSSRLPLSGDTDIEFENAKLVQNIKTILGLFDWKNISLFRKTRFTHLTPGRYLIKIWLENTLLGNGREFIGLQVVDVQKDMETHIFCRPEGRISVSVLNQNETGVENAGVYLLKDEMLVAEKQSDSDGKAVIAAPCSLRDKYMLRMVYNGFLVYEEQVRLGFITRILPLEKPVDFEVHDLTIDIRDANGSAPAFDVDMHVTSDEMDYPILIPAEKVSNGTYRFVDLYPAVYTLSFSYNSFEVEETVHLPMVTEMTVDLYDLNVNLTDDWGLPPDASFDIVLTCKELKKPVVIPGEQVLTGEYLFANLYPANYTIKLFYKSVTVEEPVRVPYKNNSGTLAMVFPVVFNVTTMVYDARGNPMHDVKVLIMREGQELQGFTGENTTFSLPPGTYVSRIYNDDRLIAERKIDVTSEKTFAIVTTEEPLFPFIIIGLASAMVVLALFFTYRKKDVMSFLHILAVALAIIAVVSPWWMLHGSSSTPWVETSTSMFLIPPELVTITSTSDVVAGELASLDPTFVIIMGLLPVLTVIGCICIVSSMLLKRYAKKRSSFTFLLLGLVIFVVTMSMFFYVMSQLAEMGVGSVLGQGGVEASIPGEGIYETLMCSWGPGTGFYLYLFSIMILIFVLVFNVRQKLFRETRKKITNSK